MAKLAGLVILISVMSSCALLGAEAPTTAGAGDVAAYASSLPIGSVAPAFNVTEVRGGKVLCFL